MKNRPNHPHQIDHYISLVTGPSLEHSVVREFYKLAKVILGSDKLVTLASDENGEPRQASLVHRIQNAQHHYIIPLARHLTESELEYFITHCVSQLPLENWNIESSTEEVGCCPDMDPEEQHEMDTLNELNHELARYNHQRWMDRKLSQGWRYGMIMDEKQRTHPLLRPWHELPEQHRDVDDQLAPILIDVLHKNGYSVVNSED